MRSSGRESAGPQCRKVFVGGVPLEMEEDEFHDVFNSISCVKRAWLQRHTDSAHHRGFGFVTFGSDGAVDMLLGSGVFSRRMTLPNGRCVEVKRALPSGKATGRGHVGYDTMVPAMQRTQQQQQQMSHPQPMHQTRFMEVRGVPLQQVPSFLDAPSTGFQSAVVSEVQPQMPPPWLAPIVDGGNGAVRSAGDSGYGSMTRVILPWDLDSGMDLEAVLLQAAPNHYDD